LIRLAVFGPEAAARVKLHFKSWSWFHHRLRCICRLGWANSRHCWVSLYSTQPTFLRCYHKMRNPTTACFGTDSQKFLLWSDWTLAASGRALL